jgi:hypothetical protein
MAIENDEIRPQWPDPNKIMCKDCIFRDKTEIKVNDKIIKCGVTKDLCRVYLGPPHDNGKPHDVLFLNDYCEFYEEEKNK